jgi:branched-chain amino acid transport system ATP-binding protein
VSSLLEVENVTAGYGESVVLENISFSLGSGDRLAVLGRNGAGKTTLLVTLMGLTRLHRGALHWRGADLTALSTFERARVGLGWVPQERCMFPSLTVHEHLTAVARPGPWNVRRIYQLFPRLEERRSNMGDQLSGGEQQLLAFARALMVNPRALLLDEPLEGLAPTIARQLIDVMRDLQGIAIVLVEQHARLALALTEQAIVIERGTIAYRGKSKVLLEDTETLHRLLTVA